MALLWRVVQGGHHHLLLVVVAVGSRPLEGWGAGARVRVGHPVAWGVVQCWELALGGWGLRGASCVGNAWWWPPHVGEWLEAMFHSLSKIPFVSH